MKTSWKDIRKAYESACDASGIEYGRADQEQDKKFWELVLSKLNAKEPRKVSK